MNTRKSEDWRAGYQAAKEAVARLPRKDLIAMAIESTRKEAYVPEYQAGADAAECLGMAVANWAEWDGDKIMAVCLAALEQAKEEGW